MNPADDDGPGVSAVITAESDNDGLEPGYYWFDTWDFYSKWGFGGLDEMPMFLEHHGYPDYSEMNPEGHAGYRVPTLTSAEVPPDALTRTLVRGTLTISFSGDPYRKSFAPAVLAEVLLTQVAPAVRQPLEVIGDYLGDNPVRAQRVDGREAPELKTTLGGQRLVIDREWHESMGEPVPEFDPVFELSPRYVGVPTATVLAIAQQVAATAPPADPTNEGP